jgi:hypothetical protein
MSGQRWVIGAIAALVLASTGCVSCADKCYRKAVQNAPECELPPPCRSHVYVYMIHGCTPTTSCGLEALQLKLSESGFAKIGVGELVCAPLMKYQIKDTLKCDPDAKFVLLGYDVGGAAAVFLARELSAKGVPVEAVVLLDPLACGAPSGVRTLLITSGTTTSTVPYTDRLVVPDASHFKLPTHPQTLEAITELLKEIAWQNYQEPGDPVPMWSYPHAPEMHQPANGTHNPEWNFLADTSETPPGINPPTATQPMQTLAPAVPSAPSTAAGPVLIKR